MQVLVVFFLAALVGCYGDGSGCLEESETCLAALPPTITKGSLEPISCKVLIESIECLEKAVNDGPCAGAGEIKDLLKGTIDEIKETTNEKCDVQSTLSENDEVQKCYEEHVIEIGICTKIALAEAIDASISAQSEPEDFDDRVKCSFYMAIGQCTYKKIKKTCGAEVAEQFSPAVLKNNFLGDITFACEVSRVFLGALLEDDEVRKCYEEHKVIFSCVDESSDEVMDALDAQSFDHILANFSKDFHDRARCAYYVGFGKCTLKKIEEKCGADVAEKALLMELNNVPAQVTHACEAAGVILGTGIFNEEKNKK